MKLLQGTLILAGCAAALATLACADGRYVGYGGDYDRIITDSRETRRTGNWDDRYDGRWEDRHYLRSDDRREGYWDIRRGGWDERYDGVWVDRRDARNDDRRDTYWEDRRSGSWDDRRNWDDRRHDSSWSWGNERYAVPRSSDMNGIRNLSQTLNQRVNAMAEELGRDSRSSTYQGAGPIAAMQSSARAFREQVAGNMSRPERTVSAFQQVKESRDRLNQAASRRDLDRRAERHLTRINEAAAELDRFYMRSTRRYTSN